MSKNEPYRQTLTRPQEDDVARTFLNTDHAVVDMWACVERIVTEARAEALEDFREKYVAPNEQPWDDRLDHEIRRIRDGESR